MSKGKFVVIDGGDGAGKTTLIKQLEAEFKQRNILFHDTREPGGSRYAEEIRSLILNKAEARNADAETMFALFWAARRDHVVNTISRLCEKGILVVSDRFDSSTYAYQIFGQEEKQLEDLFWVVRNHYLRGCEPDVYIWIDVDPHVGMRRRAFQRDEKNNHFDERQLAFHLRVQEGFRTFMSKCSSVHFDGNKAPEEVYKEVLDYLLSFTTKRQ